MNFFGRMWGDKLDNVPDFMCDSVCGPNLIGKTKDLYKKYY